MASRHHPFVFHKQYVLTLSQAGATTLHVRPPENRPKKIKDLLSYKVRVRT